MLLLATKVWEQRKLSSLFIKFTDGDWIESKDQSNSGIRLIQTGNIGVSKFINKVGNEKWISEKTLKELNCTEIFPGDIIISRLPEPTGRACILPEFSTRMITAVDCTIARVSKSVSAEFIVQYLSTQTYFKYIQSRLAGGTRQRISRKNLADFNTFIPALEEQKEIGLVFNYLDSLIALYERKYQLYLLQFQKLQRVIFDNSDDFISLSYLIEIKTGNRNSQDNVKNGKYVFFDRSTEIKRLNEFDFDEEAIIIPGEGTKFAPKYINGKYALHQRSYSLYNFSQEIDSKYLYYFLMTQSNTLLRYSVGTTVPSLRVSTFDHIKVPMYSKELQIKYALTFDSLEKLMNQIKKKTNILRSLKRFLLQVLFL